MLNCVRDVRSDGITRAQLIPGFAHVDEWALTTASALFQSRRRADGRLSTGSQYSA